MLLSRAATLSCGLLILATGMCGAQTSTDTASDYWKNSDAVGKRVALRKRIASRLMQDDADNSDALNVGRTGQSDVDFQDDGDVAPEEREYDDEQTSDGLFARESFVWPEESIREININPRTQLDKVPDDRSYMLSDHFSRNWYQFETVQKDYRWQSPSISYQPLYFEDVALERYGQWRPGIQAFVSYAHFFKSAVLLPWHMGVDPPYSCEYPLGYCRPGVCTNAVRQKHFWR